MGRRINESDIEKALIENKGLIFQAALALNTNRSRLGERIKRSEHLTKVLHDAREIVLDKTENKLFDAIEAGQPWAVALYLKTIGKIRGYAEYQQVEVTGNMSIDLTKLSTSELEQLDSLVSKAESEQ